MVPVGIDDLVHERSELEPFLYPLVFIIVLVAGFIALAFQDSDRCHERKRPAEAGEATDCPSWDDVGEEFRLMWYDSSGGSGKS
ncbi:MAG: hypothetical protein WC382_05625 [Methanoregulaceae archaeon]